MHFLVISKKTTHEPLTISLNIDLKLHLRNKLLVQFMEAYLQSTLTKKVKEYWTLSIMVHLSSQYG